MVLNNNTMQTAHRGRELNGGAKLLRSFKTLHAWINYLCFSEPWFIELLMQQSVFLLNLMTKTIWSSPPSARGASCFLEQPRRHNDYSPRDGHHRRVINCFDVRCREPPWTAETERVQESFLKGEFMENCNLIHFLLSLRGAKGSNSFPLQTSGTVLWITAFDQSQEA